MLPTLNPHPPPRAWVTFPAVFQLTRHSECQQPDPRSSMRHFRTFPSPGITAEDPSREQNTPFRSRDNPGRPLREQNAPSRSRDNLGRPSREQNAAFRSRDNLGRHRQAFPVPILSPGHFGTPDKHLLYQKLSQNLFRITYFLRSCFELFV